MENTHGSIGTCCVSCFLVMSDLRVSDCLLVEESAAVFQYYTGWERRLVGKCAMKESYIVEKIASIMKKHVPSTEETRKLKGIGKIDACAYKNLTMCIFALYVHRLLSICSCVLYVLNILCVIYYCMDMYQHSAVIPNPPPPFTK